MDVKNTIADLQADVDLVGRIPIVPSLLNAVCKTTGMGFAAIARVTEEKWVACSVQDEILFGLKPGEELKLETTICHEIRQNQQLVVIDHVEKDEAYRDHHTPLLYGFQSYISVPIMRKNGSFFGTLCAIDPRPAKLRNPETIAMFNLFADLISFHIDAIETLALSEARLLEEQKTAELRDQFIAILGHDLRNPLGSVIMGAELLLTYPLEEETMDITRTIQKSSRRMSGLIENILDFARGRLGEGITLNRTQTQSLDKSLEQVIAELQTIWPGRAVEIHFDFKVPVFCDTNRIAQLFSNLVGNAFIHGKADAPVIINGVSNEKELKLSVCNQGNQIKEADSERLFQPFYRGEDKSGKSGLGLGLYIAHEIATAHGGEIKLTSTSEETCFTLIIPASEEEC